MAIYYPQGCLADYVYLCSPCPNSEGGRIRHIAFIKTAFAFIDITDPAEWTNGISEGSIIVIPNINGISDGGSPAFSTTVGDLPKRLLYRTYKINITDGNFKNNCFVYNFLSKSKNYRIAYLTESVLQISDKAVSIFVKDGISEPVESERTYDIEAEFSQLNMPFPYHIPSGIFNCKPGNDYLIDDETMDYILDNNGYYIRI